MDHWRKNIALFLTSRAISLFGSSVVSFAIVWCVTRETTSGLWVSLFTASSYIPQFIISFFAGVWADRYSRKKLIIAADAMIAACTGLLVLLLPKITDSTVLMAALLGISFLRSVGTGIQTPAVSAVLPSIVPEYRLMKINGYNASVQSAVQFAAPAAAGLVLSFMPLRAALLIDIVTAIIGIGILCFVSVPGQSSAKSAQAGAMFADMKKGTSYVFSEPGLKRLIVSFGAFIFLCVPAGFLCSLYVTRTFSDSYMYLSGVEPAGFAGMTVGGLLMAAFSVDRSRMKIYCTGIVGFGILAGLLAAASNFILYPVLMAVFGVILTVVQTSSTTFFAGEQRALYAGPRIRTVRFRIRPRLAARHGRVRTACRRCFAETADGGFRRTADPARRFPAKKEPEVNG